MTWIAKDPPIYVWPGDKWYNERNGKTYSVDCERFVWLCDEEIPIVFPKKARIMRNRGKND